MLQGRPWQSVHEAGGCYGRYVGGGRYLVGSRRAAVHLVSDRHDQRLSGRLHLHRRGMSAAGHSCLQATNQQESEDQCRATGQQRLEHHQPRNAKHRRQRHAKSIHENGAFGDDLLKFIVKFLFIYFGGINNY